VSSNLIGSTNSHPVSSSLFALLRPGRAGQQATQSRAGVSKSNEEAMS